ncbi:hypothetical protein E4U53_001443 [Claviceps sorghi]|nr:hypothetical protein E4U53_001443 [Claviceps sorghi]
MESSISVPDDTSQAKPWIPDDGEHGKLEAGCVKTEESNKKPTNSSKTEMQEADKIQDKVSSNYASVVPSTDSSPSAYEAHSYVLSQQDMENLELSPIRWYRRLPTRKELGHSESSYATAEEQAFSNTGDDSDVPELLGAFICHPDGPKRESRNRGPVEEQITAPDLNKPLPSPSFRNNLGHETDISPSPSGESCAEILQGTPKRASLKQKLQKSLSGLSKLGDHNKMDRTIPEIPSSRESQKPIMSSYR